MVAVLLWGVAIVMTATAIWRLPAALRYKDPLRRALWACTAAFSLTIWCRVPQVKTALDESAVTDLSALAKYVTSLIAILAALTYINAVYGSDSGRVEAPRHVAVSRRVSRVAHGSAFAALVTLVVLFFTVVDRSTPSTDFAADHAGEWGAALFLSIQYTYLGAAAATCCYQWSRASRRAETKALRIGLALMATAMVIYTVYPAVRIVTVWFPTGVDSLTMRTVADSVNLTVATLWVIGAAVPTTVAITTRWATWRGLRALRPLRADLIGHFPALATQPAGPRIVEALHWSPELAVRLDSRTQEIADAVEQLRHHATPSLFAASTKLADSHSDPEPAAEAYWIKAALETARSGRRSDVPSKALPCKPLTSSFAEAAWLGRVASVYATVTSEQLRLLHDQAGEPPIVAAEN